MFRQSIFAGFNIIQNRYGGLGRYYIWLQRPGQRPILFRTTDRKPPFPLRFPSHLQKTLVHKHRTFELNTNVTQLIIFILKPVPSLAVNQHYFWDRILQKLIPFFTIKSISSLQKNHLFSIKVLAKPKGNVSCF